MFASLAHSAAERAGARVAAVGRRRRRAARRRRTDASAPRASDTGSSPSSSRCHCRRARNRQMGSGCDRSHSTILDSRSEFRSRTFSSEISRPFMAAGGTRLAVRLTPALTASYAPATAHDGSAFAAEGRPLEVPTAKACGLDLLSAVRPGHAGRGASRLGERAAPVTARRRFEPRPSATAGSA